MLTRIVTSIVLVPVAALACFGPRWVFLALAVVAGTWSAFEVAALLERAGYRPLRLTFVTGGVLLNVAFHAPEHLPLSAALAACAALAVGEQVLWRREIGEALESIGATLGLLVLPILLIAFQVGLRGLPRAAAVLLFVYGVVFGNDIAAYFGGRWFGRRKLAPAISPGKTIEGFLIGLAVATGIGVAVELGFGLGIGTARAAGFAFVVAAAAVLGDLTVSLLKRSVGAKDMGSVLPGHGGVLDRLDGLLFASPLLYLLLTTPAIVGPAAAS